MNQAVAGADRPCAQAVRGSLAVCHQAAGLLQQLELERARHDKAFMLDAPKNIHHTGNPIKTATVARTPRKCAQACARMKTPVPKPLCFNSVLCRAGFLEILGEVCTEPQRGAS